MDAAPVIAPAATPVTIAGHRAVVIDRAGSILSIRIVLEDGALATLARALGRLDGVRVTGGPEGVDGTRCYIAHCPGFKMVVSAPQGERTDFALALVSRAPQATLAVMSDLEATLERLMTPPPAPAPSAPRAPAEAAPFLRRAPLKPGKPLARKGPLRRNKPLRRGPPRR